MKRRTVLGAVGGATLVGGGYFGWELFAPERATTVDEDRVAAARGTESSEQPNDTTAGMDGGDAGGDDAGGDTGGGATVLKRGEFEGKDGHECSGTVELAEDADGRFLQFRDFRMTQGPDVYCYVTPGPDPDTSAAIRAGTKVRIDGGADDGELTKTGTFAQSLPDGVDVADVAGVAAWCDDFAVPFGAATLDRA